MNSIRTMISIHTQLDTLARTMLVRGGSGASLMPLADEVVDVGNSAMRIDAAYELPRQRILDGLTATIGHIGTGDAVGGVAALRATGDDLGRFLDELAGPA